MSAYRVPIGVIAGLGPLAGATFYRHLVEATDADDDAGHPEVVLISDPAIPSRLEHLTGTGPSPLPQLVSVARRLVAAGSGLLALTSITTHAYYEELCDAVDAPVVDGREAVAAGLSAAGVTSVALAVTSPARRLGLLEKPLADAGIEVHYPGDDVQHHIQTLVERVKTAGATPELGHGLAEILGGSWAAPAAAVLVGCTDISPLAAYLGPARGRVFDVSRLIAEAVLHEAARR
ncbi:aspartate/glutamate racemase family protein [Microbispora sp. RL4-1S]|uniref:Aspartate/glutamate racemase family protein n=1 Tax=Microbispora oryzae TaxID=2806554 RepID=A0A940WS92_9ACTN|nr:aspartate/glutamate racemase family protein [Microbispora oryzae]MBP2708453.1 aspartate/glutamate racemase family protein [Microbispora oryzae]